MNPSLSLAILLLSAGSARALDVGNEDPKAFVQRSKNDPERLYALLVGASWCEPCHRLSAALAAVDSGSGTAVGRAAWNKVEFDKYGQDRFIGFLSDMKANDAGSIPYVLVFRGGEAIGYTTGGNDLQGIGQFLKETEERPAGRATAQLPRLLCPGRKDDASFTLGISGMFSENDHSTDGFGVATMLAFNSGDNGSPSALLAPSKGTAVVTESATSGTGAYFASSPSAPYAKRISSVSVSTSALAAFPQAPGRRLRLILTGHGGPEGMMIGSKPSGIMGVMIPLNLTEPEVTSAVTAARRNGKEVRGLVLNCFGGQFGEAFMPVVGPAAPACAAFATLPEKESEGCYDDSRIREMSDYTTIASRALDCASPVDGRTRHYQVVLATVSRDVPMLSSEYFLLYGPGAAYLGRGEDAPAPARGVGRYDLSSRVSVYMDLIGGGVLAARQDGRSLPLPRISVKDCRNHLFAPYSLDGKHAVGSFFLRSRSSGPKRIDRADCSPVVSFHWDPEEWDGLPDEEADLDAPARVYVPTSDVGSEFNHDFTEVLAPAKVNVSMRGLKQEARVLLTAVMPKFAEPLGGISLENALKETAARLRRDDAPLADALSAMTVVARTNARQRRAKLEEQNPYLLGDMKPVLNEVRSSAQGPAAAVAGPAEPDPGDFTTDVLTKAMWRNVSPGEYEGNEDISMFRLAHLTAAAEAELALRSEAPSSPKARRLLTQLESLQACERGLY